MKDTFSETQMNLANYANLSWLEANTLTRYTVQRSATKTVVYLRYVANEDNEHWLVEVGDNVDAALTLLDVSITDRMKALKREVKRRKTKEAHYA